VARRKESPEGGKPDVEKQEREAAEAKAAEAAEEKAEATGEKTEDAPESKADGEEKGSKRRGSAETGADAKKGPSPQARPAPRRESDGAIEVRAQAKYVRTAPRKARLVMEHIRGKPVSDALAILAHTPRAAAKDVDRLLRSAVANAENNFELDADGMRVDAAYVDEGPTIKRYRPRALGRATRIDKRTSHMTITLTVPGSAGESEE